MLEIAVLGEKGTNILNGKVAVELSVDKYGGAEWWLLLEPLEQQS